MRFHWQNLNDKPGGRRGSGVRHGRAWLTLSERYGLQVNWEWVVGGKSCHASVTLKKSEDRGLGLSLAIPLVGAIYLTLSGGPLAWLALKVLPEWNFDDGEDRTFEVSVHDWAIWWTVWRDRMASWSRQVPRWRQGSWHPLDTFLGKQKYSERPFHTGEIVVPMPERSYRGTIVLSEDTWKRPRWPFSRRLVRAKVDMLKGEQIPEPGKGENSWDCGEDALFGWGGPAESVSDAVGKIVATVTRTRLKRGGSRWQPEATRKADARG